MISPHWEVIPAQLRQIFIEIGRQSFVERFYLAGLVDIGLMKMDAIAGRGSRKDFYDLYFIAQHTSLEELLELGKEKYSHVRDFGMMVLSALVDYSIADQEVPVETFPSIGWDSVKEFFEGEAKRIGRSWFE